MEGLGCSGFGSSAVVKKRRSSTSRRPRPDSQLALGNHILSPPSSTPSSDNPNKLFPEGKEFFINNTDSSRKIKKDDKRYGKFDGFCSNVGNIEQARNRSDLKRHSEVVVALASWKSSSKGKESFEKQSIYQDGYVGKSGDGHRVHQVVKAPNVSAENMLRKVKFKLGGVTRMVHSISNLEAGNSSSSAKALRSSDASRHRQKLICQDNSDDNCFSQEKANGLQGDPRKGFGGSNFSHEAKEDSRDKVSEENLAASSEPVRKSKRVPKRRVLDATFDNGDKDDEIRYLGRLKASKVARDYTPEYGDGKEDSAKKRKISNVSKSRSTAYNVDEAYGLSSRSTNDSRKKSRSGRESSDTDYVEEEDPGSDTGSELKRKKQMVSVDSSTDGTVEPLTTRQRALQAGKEGIGLSFIEFPNGLPPAPPRKQKEKLSNEEQQAKKAEAAQRRKMQVEKAARESEAMAIRKILGLDSDKKKAEKERARAEKAKAANSQTILSSTVRLVMGPNGTVVTFPKDVDLPSIFDSKPCSYPPPREKCAGPSCTNSYRYRDSRSNLPLCSLQCYRAVQGSAHPVTC